MTFDPTSIKLEEINISRTYAGVMEGIPPKQVVLNIVMRKVDKMHPYRPYVMLPALTSPVRTLDSVIEVLPHWLHIGLLIGDPKGETGHGSHLVVVWFDDKPSIDMDAVLANVDWAFYSRDFEY